MGYGDPHGEIKLCLTKGTRAAFMPALTNIEKDTSSFSGTNARSRPANTNYTAAFAHSVECLAVFS